MWTAVEKDTSSIKYDAISYMSLGIHSSLIQGKNGILIYAIFMSTSVHTVDMN